MISRSESDSTETLTPTEAERRGITCAAVVSMLEIGPKRLTDEALGELADHMDLCSDCRIIFDTRFGENEDEPTGEPGHPLARTDIIADLTADVLNYIERVRDSRHVLTMVPLRNERSGYGVTLLAPGTRLRGKTWDFIVGERMGFSEFTETYSATCVPVAGAATRAGVRAVIKLPRIADEMSSDSASKRIEELRTKIQVHIPRFQKLAGKTSVAPILDCGEYGHGLRDGSEQAPFVAYAFVEGVDLPGYLRTHCSRGDGEFRGVQKATEFAKWARMLTRGVLEIHSCPALHGDICPDNIIVTDKGEPIFVDAGQSLFREVMNGAQAFSGEFYRPPEGIRTKSSDLFSLGGVFYYLATGKQPIGFGQSEKETLKRELTLKIKEANPALYQDDAGIADIITMCLRRPEDRIQDARQILRDIDTFWPMPGTIAGELTFLTESAKALDQEGSTLYSLAARSHIRSLAATLMDMTRGEFKVAGNPADMRSAACMLLSTLSAGDKFITPSYPAFWYPENIGINGRFLSMCRNAAAHGASIKRLFLLDDALSDPHLQQIVAAQLEAVADLDPESRSNFAVRFIQTKDRRQLVASGKHFGLLVKGDECVSMSPVYDSQDALISLVFRKEAEHDNGRHTFFDELWGAARPLIDLNLRRESVDFTSLEKMG